MDTHTLPVWAIGGFMIAFVGLRLTSEVAPILLLIVVMGLIAGLVLSRNGILAGLLLGAGFIIGRVFEPALTAEHIARYGKSQPLPLPFGMTDSRIAQQIAGAALIMMFPLVAASIGWIARRIGRAI